MFNEKIVVLETKETDLRKNNARIMSELKNKVVSIDELKKEWTKELESKKLSELKKDFITKFVKTGLGYEAECSNQKVKMISSHEKFNVSHASHKSHRNSSAYHDPKITAMYHKSGEVPKKGIDFEREKLIFLIGLLSLSMLVCLPIVSAGTVGIQDTTATLVLTKNECGGRFLLM